MPLFVAIWAFILATVVPIVIHVLKALGIGIIVYSGADFVITTAESYVFSNYDSLPANMWTMFTLAGIDAGIKILFSAYAANIAIRASTGSFKKFGIS